MKTTTHLGAYVSLWSGDSIVLVLKTRGPYLGCWDLPGGRIEDGESPDAALIREVREELGLDLIKFRFLSEESVFATIKDLNGTTVQLHHTGYLYDADSADRTPLRQGGDREDTAEARWFSRAKAQDLPLTPFAAHMLGAISQFPTSTE